LAAFTLVTLLMVTVSIVFQAAADDLYGVSNAFRDPTAEQARSGYGRWLSAHLAPDVDLSAPAAIRARADILAYRSDRLRELAAIPAVAGLLVALLTDAPSSRRPNASTQPVANTTSNGTA
jgi:hypothetical protein